MMSRGPMPKILMDDGNKILRITNEDGYELRVGFRNAQYCSFPGANVRVKLS